MKSFLTLALALVALPAFAAPTAVKVGSAVGYTATSVKAGVTDVGTLAFEVTAEDATAGTYKVKGKLDVGADKQDDETDWDQTDVSGGADILADCAGNGGAPEDLTVAAGTFKTCHITQEDKAQNYKGDFWIGDVPFMTVKSVESQGAESFSLELATVK
jgi:hypothetical protein